MGKNEEKVLWSRDETWTLINCLEANEILWNFALKDYHNKMKKEAAFAEVAAKLKTKSVGDIKKKLHALRSQHCGERMKIKKKKSGSGAEDNYKPKWEFFSALNFIFKDAGTAGSVVDSMDNVNTATDTDSTSGPSILCPNDVGTDEDTFVVLKEPIAANPNKMSKRKRQKEEDEHLKLAYKILEAPDEKEDSTTIFGKYVGEKLNQFDAYTKAVLTQKINNLIFEAELSTIGNRESTATSPSPTSNSSPNCSPKNTSCNDTIVELNEYLII